jgi:hypothetical protein
VPGYYRSSVCSDCAGFDVGHLLSDLILKEDSTFILRHYATRFSPAADTSVVLKIEGSWSISINDVVLKPSHIFKSNVDSRYNHISDTTITVDNKKNILARLIKSNNGKGKFPNCAEIFSYQKE